MEIVEHTAEKTNPWVFALNLGFFAGVIWGGVKMIAYYLKFTRVLPGFMVEPFFLHKFLRSVGGTFTGWGFFILFSILASLLYVWLFRKAKGPYPGIVYGLAWWAIWFLFAGPLCGMVKPVIEWDVDSVVTEICLFTLWGLFIGYTINYEFTEERAGERAS